MPGGGLDPHGGGTEMAIKAALEEAGLDPGAIGHVNAHGSASRSATWPRPGRSTGSSESMRAPGDRASRATWATSPLDAGRSS